MTIKRLALLFLLAFFAINAFGAGEYCNSNRLQWYSPAPGITHQVATLTDPAGQQVALFDLSWGGILVSLKYNGVEFLAAPTTTAGVQLTLRAPNYTPTQGGDDMNRGSTVTGVACAQNYLWITTGMTDYNRNAAASTAYVYRNENWYFDHFMAPYTISTYAYFVPNPAGSPAYYLRMDHAVMNLDFAESYSFTLDQSISMPLALGYLKVNASCIATRPCGPSTPYLAYGGYNSGSYTDGVALATFPATNWPGMPGNMSLQYENLGNHLRLHIKKATWSVAPLTGRKHSTVVMTGSWANALNYASKACTFSVSLPVDDIVPVGGKTETLTVTTGAGCQWEAWTDAPSVITMSPGGIRTGSGSVNVTITPNSTGQIRQGNLFIAGREFPYFQHAQ